MQTLKIISSLILMIVVISIGQSQSGTIVLEVVDVSSDNPQLSAMADMLKGSTTSIHFKDKMSISKMNLVGGMVKVDIKVDEEEKSDMLMDMMGNKIWVEMSKLEAQRMKAAMDNPMSEMDITYDMEDKKEIFGLACYKMVVEFPDAPEGTKIEGYISEAITVRPPIIKDIDVNEFKGFPLEFTFSTDGMSLTTVAQSYEDTVDEALFDIKTAGYKKMSMSEFVEMMSSMGGGGFGF